MELGICDGDAMKGVFYLGHLASAWFRCQCHDLMASVSLSCMHPETSAHCRVHTWAVLRMCSRVQGLPAASRGKRVGA